jgi:hypothetical protein
MVVSYEELGGSPTLSANRTGSTAKRMVRIAWNDIDNLMLELMPVYGSSFNPLTQLPGWFATFPNRPGLVVESVEFEPFVPERPLGLGEVPPQYPGGAKATINYKTPEFDSTFFNYSVNIGGEMLTLPSYSLQWANAWSPIAKQHQAALPVKAGQAFGSVSVIGDVQGGFVVPTIEHTLEWHYVAFPPFSSIRAMVGTVNTQEFLGAPRATLLFLGAEISREWTLGGRKYFQMKYRFAEKNVSAPFFAGIIDAGVGNVVVDTDDVPGWNYFYRPETGLFERLLRSNGGNVYEDNVFDFLFVQGL